jgi:NitT/TauT family transport system substrate-binding protein
LLAEGKADAVLGFASENYEIRAKNTARSIVNTTTDRPWSQYFCCVAVGNREFIARYPVTTRLVLRAFLKAADVCGTEPARSARLLVERGFLRDSSAAEMVLRDLPYNRWREFDSEDSLRFLALRLHAAGAIHSDPNKLLAQGTDWSFINDLKKQLKG